MGVEEEVGQVVVMVVPKDMEVEAAVVAEQVMVVEHTEVDMEVVVELVVVTVAVVKKEDMMVDMHLKQRRHKKKHHLKAYPKMRILNLISMCINKIKDFG